jgi:hypothetical protein
MSAKKQNKNAFNPIENKGLENFIESGDTLANRRDLYDEIENNLDHICSLAQVAQVAHKNRDQIDPSIMASYFGTFLEVTYLLSSRFESLRKDDACYKNEQYGI